MSARRSTATTVIASVIRPSRVIASTSSNGSQRTSSASVGSGVAVPGSKPGRQEEHGELVGDRVREMDPGELAPRLGLDAGLLAQLALRAPSSALSPSGTPPSGISHE